MDTNIIISISKYVENIINHVDGYSLEKGYRIFKTHIAELDLEYKRQTTVLNLNNKAKLNIESGNFAEAIKDLIFIYHLNKTKSKQVQIAVQQDFKKIKATYYINRNALVNRLLYEMDRKHNTYDLAWDVITFRGKVEEHQVDVLINNLEALTSRLNYELDSLGQSLVNKTLTNITRADLVDYQLKLNKTYKFTMDLAEIINKGAM